MIRISETFRIGGMYYERFNSGEWWVGSECEDLRKLESEMDIEDLERMYKIWCGEVEK